MSKNAVHTSPDLFNPDTVNVFDPNTTEMIGQVRSTPEGNVTTSTRSQQLSMFDQRSDSYGHLKGIKRQRVKVHVHPWEKRMKVYNKNHKF